MTPRHVIQLVALVAAVVLAVVGAIDGDTAIAFIGGSVLVPAAATVERATQPREGSHPR